MPSQHHCTPLIGPGWAESVLEGERPREPKAVPSRDGSRLIAHPAHVQHLGRKTTPLDHDALGRIPLPAAVGGGVTFGTAGLVPP